MDLLDRIDGWGRSHADRIAHRSGSRSITYGELLRRSDSVAAWLAQRLPADHSPVAVLGHKEPEMMIAFLGVVKAGHPYIPIDTSVPQRRVENIIEVSQAPITLTPEMVAAIPDGPLAGNSRRLSPQDPFYIIFTSGSTGEPKGVVINLRCLTAFLTWMLGEHPFAEGREIFLNQAPFSFDLSVMDLYLSLATGGVLFSLEKDAIVELKQLYNALRASEVTVWVSTPSFAQMCLVERSFSQSMLPRLRRFLFCGETLPPEVAAQLLDRFPLAEVWNTYGPTETTVATTSVRVDREMLARYSPLPVGYPMTGTQIVVLDDEGQPVTGGARGEIVIAGPNVSPGYFARPHLTRKAFFSRDGMQAYRTGDLGRWQDKMLFFEGRIDSQIKLNGYRIELGDLEANLRALDGVLDAVVLPKTRNSLPESIAAFVILSERAPESDFEASNRLRSLLGERLPAYMLPRKFIFVDCFPLTPNGKADRRRLAERLG